MSTIACAYACATAAGQEDLSTSTFLPQNCSDTSRIRKLASVVSCSGCRGHLLCGAAEPHYCLAVHWAGQPAQ